MRRLADLQRDPDDPTPAEPAALPLDVQRERTFDTPEFSGMRFLEVEAKSALNKVQGMPFGWSINPYRGCSHACTYCLAGDTPVLMADGRTTRIAEIQPGDTVYGTQRRGVHRRYVTTQVLDHWQTRRPAYRVALADGTELVASGDHRFLTERGWKHVADSRHRRRRRPHLTTDDSLLGVGAFAAPPKETFDYRRGYLCGTLGGDGPFGSYGSDRGGRSPGDVHRFGSALVDGEALDRVRRYLAAEGVHRYLAAEGVQAVSLTLPEASPVGELVVAGSAGAVAAVQRLIASPGDPSDDWQKGFLAGVFDAEGGGTDVTRVFSTDPVRFQWVQDCAAGLGFRLVREFVRESRRGSRPALRLQGGLPARLRFLHTVDSASTRKRTIEGVAIEGVAIEDVASLEVVGVESLGIETPMYDLTTGTGDFVANGVVSHNCFARPSHSYLNLSPAEDFERTVVVKTNLVSVLRRELARPSWHGEHVAMGTNTDPYQRCEGRYRLMPGVVDALADGLTPFSILTKGTMITRDVDRLAAAAEKVPVTTAFTVGMLDDAVWRDAEPGTPSPAARLEAVRRLNDAGIPTGVMVAPIMPGLNDDWEQLAAVVDAAAAAGATHITPIVLHLRPGVREVFWPWLTAKHPELVDRYAQLYQKATADRAYREPLETFVAEQRRAAWDRHGWPASPPAWRGPRRSARGSGEPSAGSGPEQLSLL